MKLIYKIAFVIIFLFSLVGMIVMSIALHELTHRWDFRELRADGKIFDEEMCLLGYGKHNGQTYAGYYLPHYYPKYENEIDKIIKYTEIKAYAVTLTIMIIYEFCFFVIIHYIMKRGEKCKK